MVASADEKLTSKPAFIRLNRLHRNSHPVKHDFFSAPTHELGQREWNHKELARLHLRREGLACNPKNDGLECPYRALSRGSTFGVPLQTQWVFSQPSRREDRKETLMTWAETIAWDHERSFSGWETYRPQNARLGASNVAFQPAFGQDPLGLSLSARGASNGAWGGGGPVMQLRRPHGEFHGVVNGSASVGCPGGLAGGRFIGGGRAFRDGSSDAGAIERYWQEQQARRAERPTQQGGPVAPARVA